MRFTLHPEHWVLEFLTKTEWHFVEELPKLASGQGFDKKVRDSLLAPPVVDADGKPVESEETRDWAELVRPDLEEGFAHDRNVVEEDLKAFQTTDHPEEWLDEDESLPLYYEGPFWRLQVPMNHTEEWYSTLNQTRLLMNKAHHLATDNSRFLFALFGKRGDQISPEKAFLLAQYEFYCVIQNILVENVMQ